MLPMGEFMDEFFNVAEMFNPLKLTDGEIGLFTSTLIICPGIITLYIQQFFFGWRLKKILFIKMVCVVSNY